ncbi:tRNA lysidine(34) synthetase TilS [Calidifontibacter sp. DB0510]|uniref:tRNA(Ile)-lysidine synthase n=1 Tax=Metallococcus carri TaxID=1656884 RepID=A0A967EA03_9MICO|nr:tRNA lysidine(34) synthetase TilS [Metallococcus carri]NHN55369.1 tRNA lysidine(34) synthetase TilS [Metallococcus carri]NOP36446.1 tRNA lysidine(34) synthetase TilS [Calidifontibacter sp. DB2511S]
MAGPHPAVAATRVAVRPLLDHPVLVACSGGADSLALAAAVAFEAPRAGVVAGAVVVDHGLQNDSAEIAETAAAQCRSLGLAPVTVSRVSVGGAGGPEAAARSARYDALHAASAAHDDALVLLGHTRDDQAESVLLAMARGSGIRSLSGMAAAGPGVLRRPFLSVTRAQTREACLHLGLQPWDDPHNEDPAYRRVRVRKALGELESLLGPGLVSGLARTAALAREDADLLDELAADAADRLGAPPWPVDELAALPRPVRTRAWRLLMNRCGATTMDVSSTQVGWLDELITRWRGQGAIDVAGGLRVARTDGQITVSRPRRLE